MRPRLISGDSLRPPRRTASTKIKPWTAIVICAGALTLQSFLPALTPLANHLDLPLLAVVYLALARRSPPLGMAIGTLVGLAQDGLTHGPLGLFGILKTVVGFAAGSLGVYIEIQYPGARGVLAAVFYLGQRILRWTLEEALLDGSTGFDPASTLILAAIHAGLALMIYRAFDRFLQPS